MKRKTKAEESTQAANQQLEANNQQLRAAEQQLRAANQQLRATEQELRTEKDFSESMIETAQVIILVLDTEGRIVRFNAFMEELTGWRLDEVKGKDWFTTFLKSEDAQTIKAFFHEKSYGIILEDTGRHFDPTVINAFKAVESRFAKIYTDYARYARICH